jgi:hypothetical protein
MVLLMMMMLLAFLRVAAFILVLLLVSLLLVFTENKLGSSSPMFSWLWLEVLPRSYCRNNSRISGHGGGGGGGGRGRSGSCWHSGSVIAVVVTLLGGIAWFAAAGATAFEREPLWLWTFVVDL